MILRREEGDEVSIEMGRKWNEEGFLNRESYFQMEYLKCQIEKSNIFK